MSEQAFIDDGYSETVGINPVDGLHPAMEFRYRPFAGNEGVEAYRKVIVEPNRDKRKKAKATSQEQRLFKTICDRLEWWSFDELYGRKINNENLKKLNGPLFEKLYQIVFGMAAPDYIVGDDGEPQEPSDPGDDAKNS